MHHLASCCRQASEDFGRIPGNGGRAFEWRDSRSVRIRGHIPTVSMEASLLSRAALK